MPSGICARASCPSWGWLSPPPGDPHSPHSAEHTEAAVAAAAFPQTRPRMTPTPLSPFRRWTRATVADPLGTRWTARAQKRIPPTAPGSGEKSRDCRARTCSAPSRASCAQLKLPHRTLGRSRRHRSVVLSPHEGGPTTRSPAPSPGVLRTAGPASLGRDLPGCEIPPRCFPGTALCGDARRLHPPG